MGAGGSGRCSIDSTTVAGAAPASNRLPIIPTLTRRDHLAARATYGRAGRLSSQSLSSGAMIRRLAIMLASLTFVPGTGLAEQVERYDYWAPQRQMIRHGQQALMMCNGLFTSHRTLEQVFAQELAFLPQPVGTPTGGDYVVDRVRRTVAVGAVSGPTPVMRAAFRDGVGCVILAPDQGFEAIDELPSLAMPPPPGIPRRSPGRTATSSRIPSCRQASMQRRSRRRPTGPLIASRRNR